MQRSTKNKLNKILQSNNLFHINKNFALIKFKTFKMNSWINIEFQTHPSKCEKNKLPKNGLKEAVLLLLAEHVPKLSSQRFLPEYIWLEYELHRNEKLKRGTGLKLRK